VNAERPLLVDTGRGLSLKFRDRWLYSSRDPRSSPLAAAQAVAPQPDTLYLVPSPCLGHGLGELLTRIPKSSAVLGIEAETSLGGLVDMRDPRLFLSSVAEALSAYRELEAASGLRFRRCVEVRLSNGWALSPEAYARARLSIEDDIALRFRNRLSLIRMGRLWAKNVIANLAGMDWETIRPVVSMGRPTVVCGAGPSLDAALPELARLRDELFILACDTAAGALAQAGARPHAVVCLEAQVYNTEDFLPLGGAPLPAIVDLSAHPSAFRNLSGPKALSLSEWTASPFLERLKALGLALEAVPPLGSVGVLALRIARSLGNPILIVGLDFAFPEGRTHCLGSPSDLRARRAETRLVKAPAAWEASLREGRSLLGARQGGGGQNGGARDSGERGCSRPQLSDPALELYARLAAAELAEARRSGLPCLDARGRLGQRLPAEPVEGVAAGLLALGALGQSKAEPGLRGGRFGAVADPEYSRRAVRAFLEGERERTERVATMLRRGASDGEARRLLAEADVLYAHFPDPERVLALEGDALKRVAAEAAYWKGRLSEALELMEGPRGP